MTDKTLIQEARDALATVVKNYEYDPVSCQENREPGNPCLQCDSIRDASEMITRLDTELAKVSRPILTYDGWIEQWNDAQNERQAIGEQGEAPSLRKAFDTGVAVGASSKVAEPDPGHRREIRFVERQAKLGRIVAPV